MDDLSTTTALLAAAFLSAALPGPCAVHAAVRSAVDGIAVGLRVSLGVLVGLLMMYSASYGLVLGALAISQPILLALKWLGVSLLLTLAILSVRPPPPRRERKAIIGAASDFGAGAFMLLFNPLVLATPIAILPHLMTGGDPGAQTVLIGLFVFCGGGAITQIAATLVGGSRLRLFAQRPRTLRIAAAGVFVAFAVSAALAPVDSLSSSTRLSVAPASVERPQIDSALE